MNSKHYEIIMSITYNLKTKFIWETAIQKCLLNLTDLGTGRISVGSEADIQLQPARYAANQVKFILQICKTKVGTGGKRRKTFPSSKSAAPTINNLKRFTLSGISLEAKIIKKKKKNRNEITKTQNYRNSCTKEAELHKHNNN